jgi:hypothetical protein
MAKKKSKIRGGLSILVQGPPGTGKSEFAASAAEKGLSVKLLALRPKEIDSAGYVKHGINAEAELFHDPGWMPSIEEYEARGFVQLLKRLKALQQDDDVDVVVLDPITDLNELIAHELLSFEQEGDYNEAATDARQLWGTHRKKFIEVIKAATYLCHAPHPKHVICVVHTKPTSEETKVKKGGRWVTEKSSDQKAQGTRFFGDVMPLLEGSVKYDIGGEFQIQAFTDFKRERVNKGSASKPDYVTENDFGLLLKPDDERFAKVSAAYLEDERLPNHFPTLLEAIEEALEEIGGDG